MGGSEVESGFQPMAEDFRIPEIFLRHRYGRGDLERQTRVSENPHDILRSVLSKRGRLPNQPYFLHAREMVRHILA